MAELCYQPTGWERPYRYVVKRELAETKSGDLYWQYHALVINDDAQPAMAVLSWHWQQADMESALKAHKSGFGLEKFPTQKFQANWASLLSGPLAFNLVAWFNRVGLPAGYHRAAPTKHNCPTHHFGVDAGHY